jgi:hypothetical protein
MRKLMLLSLLVIATPALAQEMIEVPTDPHAAPHPLPPAQVKVSDELLPPLTPTVPPPSPNAPVPPPLVAPLPPIARVDVTDPRNYRIEPDTALMIVGGTIFSGAYMSDLIVGGEFGADKLFAPIAGPFLLINGANDPGINVLLALDGLVQAGSLAMLVVGGATKRRVFKKVTLAPVVGGGWSGVSFAGRF